MKHDFKKYLNPVFIETGSYMGDGIQAAIDAGFEQIHSIELSWELYSSCHKRFPWDSNIFIYLGDSTLVLPIILSRIKDKCTFWLDAHYSGGDTAQGAIPILKELEIIKNHHIKGHTILIDDMRLFRKGWDGITDKDIEKALAGYDISYEYGVAENDILVAQ